MHGRMLKESCFEGARLYSLVKNSLFCGCCSCVASLDRLMGGLLSCCLSLLAVLPSAETPLPVQAWA